MEFTVVEPGNLKRFFVNKVEEKKGICAIRGSEARHITKVLRMNKGDRFILIDLEGHRFQARIEAIRNDKLLVALEEKLPVPPAPPVEIILCQSMLKSRAMDYMIQKTSELGVGSIIPFSSERTVVRLHGGNTTNRMRHWQEIARESVKQADRLLPAKINSPLGFSELMETLSRAKALKIILWEGECDRDIKEILRESGDFKKIICVIGPEGGFSKSEIGIAKNAGFVSISMGRRILRAETASIAITAIIQYEMGDLGCTNT